MEKFRPCRKCVGKNGLNPEGFIIKKVPVGNGKTEISVLEECTCHIAYMTALKLEEASKRASISISPNYKPEVDYVGTKSVGDRDRLMKYVKRSTDPKEMSEIKETLSRSVLYLYGPNGTQKTTLGMWAGYQFLKAGKTVKYILMNDLIKMLLKADRDEETQNTLDYYANLDLLIIDESFMKERVTLYKSGYQLSFLDTFLRNRIQTNKKGIIFISNITLDEIDAQLFGKGIIDLVKRNTMLCNGLLTFNDNYMEEKSTINVNDLF